MLSAGILVVALVAGLFSVLLALAPKRANWAPLWTYLLILFFAAWACGSWWTPVGPASYEVSWLPFILLPLLLVAMLLAVPMPVPETSLSRLPAADANRRSETVAVMLWGLLSLLLTMLMLLVFLN